MNNSKNKVAIISSSLGIGGAQRFASTLSFILYDLGFEVHSIIINDAVEYDYKGELLNLGIQNKKGLPNKLRKAILINQYLKNHNINIIIDNRTRLQFVRDLIYKMIYGNRRCYYMVHSSKLEMYLPKNTFLVKILYRKSDSLICVSNEIEELIRNKINVTNTKTIYNGIKINDLNFERPTNLPEKYFLYFGRFDEKVKNLSLMIESFVYSEVYKNGYQLLLMGNGADQQLIETIIQDYKSDEFIKILPFTSNPLPYVQHARSTVLTSRFEGFPMSLIETLSVGIPVISVDCPTGPTEIVVDKFNGLLVKNNDKIALSEAFATFAYDNELYQFCKSNSKRSIAHLSVENISKQWEALLKN